MHLDIVNNVTKVHYNLPLSGVSFSRLFVTASIQLPAEADEGEYTYWLVDDNNKILSQGLLQIGDYVQEDKVSYQNNPDEFVQYNG